MEPHKTCLLLVGAGRGGTALIKLFRRYPGVEIAGVVDKRPDAPGLALARQLGIPTGEDYRQFLELAERGEVDLVINVTGSSEVRKELIAACPEHVEVMGGHSAKLMWDLIEGKPAK